MKKSTSLNKSKLSSYTAFAGAIVAGSAANAQVAYTDVNPDVVVDSISTSTSPYLIDFNNDATPDLIFGVQHISGSSQGLTYEGAFAYGFLPAGLPVANPADSATAVLDCGVAVGQSPLFFGGSNGTAVLGYAVLLQPINYPFSAGPWLGQTDKYLGFKFTVGTGTHYGWARLNVAADATTITIKEYAFNATPDGDINTCQTQTLGIEDVSVDNKVTIKPTLNDATVNVTPDLIGGTINLVSMTGQVVKTIVISDINTTISFEGVESGIYSVSAYVNGGSVNKRVYVK